MTIQTWLLLILWTVGAVAGAGGAAALGVAIVLRNLERRLLALAEKPRRRSHITAGVELVEFDVAEPLRLDLKKIRALVEDLAAARNRAWPEEPELIVTTSAWGRGVWRRAADLAGDTGPGVPVTIAESRVIPPDAS